MIAVGVQSDCWRETHVPTESDNEIMAAFFEYFLKYGGQ